MTHNKALKTLVLCTIFTLIAGNITGLLHFGHNNGNDELRSLVLQMQHLQNDTENINSSNFRHVFSSVYLSLLVAGELQTFSIACESEDERRDTTQIIVSLKSYTLLPTFQEVSHALTSQVISNTPYIFSANTFFSSPPTPPPVV